METSSHDELDKKLILVKEQDHQRKEGMRRLTGFLALSLFLHALSVALVYWPVRIIEYKNAPFPVESETYRPGERVGYTVDFCKYHDVPGTISRTLQYENGQSISGPAIQASGETGCRQVQVLSYVIPEDAPGGNVRITITSRYDGVLFRKQIIRNQTENFTIVR